MKRTVSRPRALSGALVSLALVTGLALGPPSFGAAVDRAPYRTIDLGAADAWGVARDSAGLLYVTSSSDAIEVFPVGAQGAAAPLRVIQGANTQLSTPRQPAFDPHGNLIVPSVGSNSIAVFAAGAGGNVAPVRALSAGLAFPTGVAADAAGNIYASNYTSNSVTVYDPTAGTGTPPIRTIAGPATGLVSPSGIAVAPNGDVYVTSLVAKSVSVFAAGAHGDVAPKRTLTNATALPAPVAVALDSSGNVYVTNNNGGVAVFAPSASGDAAPIMQLVGPSTGLGHSYGAVLDPQRFLTVTNNGPGGSGPRTVTTYQPLVPLAAPGRVRSLVVKGTATMATRLVDWAAPASNGGAAVTSYRVVVRKGTRQVLARVVTASRLKLYRSALPAGQLTVQVRARNSVGYGPAAHILFTVRK